MRIADVFGTLTSFGSAGDRSGPPAWHISIEIGEGARARQVEVPLMRFLTSTDFNASDARPVPLPSNGCYPGPVKTDHRVWLFRDCIYVTVRQPQARELDEVILRIKALHYEVSEELNRLRDRIANLEAVESYSRQNHERRIVPDDVKLHVWSRDGGVCVKCGASNELQYDHIIPLVRGGGEQVENIQLLCRNCNLKKSSRLT